MSQHDYNIANGGGAAVRGDINNALQAILTSNSGTSAPSVTAPFMLWFDTANGVLKQRNAADTAWDVFAPGRLLNVQVFTANGTYTKTAGTRFILVEGVAGGGSGGGNPSTAAGYASCSGAGACGSYAKFIVNNPASTVSVTIGAAGVSTTLGGAGGNGGNTVFGSYATLTGGWGGSAGVARNTFPSNGEQNAVSPVGWSTFSGVTVLLDLPSTGSEWSGVMLSSTVVRNSPPARSPMGGGGQHFGALGSAVDPKWGYGVGGRGDYNTSGSGSATYGPGGSQGILIVYEYS